MTPHLLGGFKVSRLRASQDVRIWALSAIGLAVILAAGAVMSQMLPAGAERWMRLAVWIAPASIGFLAWWWKVQRD